MPMASLCAVCIEMRTSDSLQLRHIGNIMNAFVRLEHIDDAVFQHMTKLVKQLRGTPSDAQSLSLIANACAKAGLVDTELFQVISQEAQDLSQESFGPQSLAVLANAFSKLGIRDHGLFRRICDVTLMQAGDSFDEQSIANLVNAFSKSCISWPKHRHQAPSAWLQLQVRAHSLAIPNPAQAMRRMPSRISPSPSMSNHDMQAMTRKQSRIPDPNI